MKSLPVPPAAVRDENAVQMLGAWIAESGLHCSLKIGMWEENGGNEVRAWGILLADVIRHIANATLEQRGGDRDRVIRSIMESLEEEIKNPTSPATGEFHHGHS